MTIMENLIVILLIISLFVFIVIPIVLIVVKTLTIVPFLRTKKVDNFVNAMNSNTRYYYKRDREITCTIERIELNKLFSNNPKVTILINHNGKEFTMVTTKKDFQELWGE
jgi:hemin uptake protein HemP